MIFNVVYALGELAVMYPVSGGEILFSTFFLVKFMVVPFERTTLTISSGFYTYSTRFIDPSWGFAMGWSMYIYLFIRNQH